MKRILAISFAVFILAALLIVPVVASAATSASTTVIASNSNKPTSLASLKVQCQLGEITLYLPYGTGMNALLHDGDSLRNMTDSTIHLYCPEFPEYVFSASRYSPVTYREPNGTNYQTVQLIVSDVSVLSQDAKTILFVCIGLAVFLSMCFELWGFVRRV